eukprot:3170961-Pleurochrysis_carterae.AAC.1
MAATRRRSGQRRRSQRVEGAPGETHGRGGCLHRLRIGNAMTSGGGTCRMRHRSRRLRRRLRARSERQRE